MISPCENCVVGYLEELNKENNCKVNREIKRSFVYGDIAFTHYKHPNKQKWNMYGRRYYFCPICGCSIPEYMNEALRSDNLYYAMNRWGDWERIGIYEHARRIKQRKDFEEYLEEEATNGKDPS